MKHIELKEKLVKVVEDAYEAALKDDQAWQEKKPELLKTIDTHFDKLLRPLFQ